MTRRNTSRLLTFEEAIKEHLNCAYCKERMWPPIRHCEKGHSLCEDCYNSCKNNECILCDERCYGTRTHHIERILEIMPFSCKYAHIGCQIRLPYKDLRKHELMCVVCWSFCLDPWIQPSEKQ